ncbi:MAG: NTP transferase domain-containing protein [Pelagibacteraceae bacterium]|jgi:N-acetyl-alpha-D-muramate 1-phosphate uridylyltransferase|nr:NTP transferase domain-containing protein [Pelagibacteraceae bacterium]
MQIQKAMILTAGYGKRMLPLTQTTPKPLVKLGPKNLLERSIELLIKIGVKEIVLNTHHLSNKIEEFIKKNNYEVSINLIKEETLLDTGGGIFNGTKQFKDEPFFVLNPDTIWNKNYYEELKVLENFYFTYKKPVLLLVDKKKSYDKSFKGDFNFISNQLIKREKNNNYIFTGAQIITRSVFSGVQKNIFSMNMIWDQLIQKQMLLGQESNQTFFHINNLKVFKELEKLKFID